MKTNRSTVFPAVLLACGLLAPTALLAQSTDPLIPTGSLSAFPVVVQPGTHPTLTWNISYPSVVTDYTDVEDGSGGGGSYIEPTTTLDADIRILGAGVTVTTTTTTRGKTTTTTSFVPTEAQLSFNGGQYARIFYGTNDNVNPNTVVKTLKNIQPGQKLRFGGRYFYNNSWGPNFTSQSGTKNVRILSNGDRPPSNVPEYGAPSLESFLRPYLDPSGKVKIGPMDYIVFMELTHTDAQVNDTGYDLQDMVLLVTFKTTTTGN